MSARSVERLMTGGKLRLVARRKVVERALDAVADRALANSAKQDEQFFGAPTQI
jgi:hypothetical protein